MSIEAMKQEPVGMVKVLPLGEGHKPMHWADWTDADNPPPEDTPLYTTPPAAPVQEPVSMRMPKVGDKVVCLEDESIGTVVYLTAGGSPEIKFDDGSHGTYMLREFAELFGYTTPPAAPVQTPITEEMHVAAVKVLHRANGVDGLPQRMLDAMLAVQPAAPVQDEFLLRGILASELKCWHRLTEDEATNLLAFVKNMAPKPAPVQEPVALKHRLVKIHDALSAHLGDTDPHIPEDMTDEEVCEYEPVFWAAKEIADLIGDAPWSNFTTPPVAPRQWAGLTGQQKNLIARISTDVFDAIHRTEAKLREKNGGQA